MTRLISLIATITLALAVLFHSPADYRMVICIIVSVAATTLAVRCLFTGKIAWALLFLGILGMFTPFQLSRFSPALTTVLSMASLALFAASPLILRKSVRPVILTAPQGRL